MNTSADVIVAGAGPAGTMSAYTAAKAGLSVIILDKSSFPRYKVCGGGLTHKIIQEIPYDVSSVIQTTITSVRFSHLFKDIFTRNGEIPLMYCTMRPELDSFMLEKAREAGAVVIMPATVREVRQNGMEVNVITTEGNFTASVLIGADGASGITARASGLKKNIEKGIAWEAEITSDKETLRKYSETVFLDWGTFPGGYGWIFPKKDHFSVGVGGPASLSGMMMDYYVRFLKSTGVFKIPDDLQRPDDIPGTTSLKAWPIPVKTKNGDFHSGRIMITGDAAGLTDPLTGEGIHYAVKSGKMAGEAAAEFIRGDDNSLVAYSKRINEVLMPELTEALRIRNIFNMVPERIHHFVRDNDRAWRAFGKVLRGERNYADVKTGFGRWKSAWSVVCFMASVTQLTREKKFRKRGFRD